MADRVVFVSCGQLTAPEIKLGRDVAAIIEGRGLRPFFAQDVHSTGDLNSEVFKAIQTCDAFLGILQKRGAVTFGGYAPVERASVWIQQEIATFCYRMFLEGRSLPIRIFSERGIRREGVMEIAVVNPIEFDDPDEVPAEVDKWLRSREFEEHPVLATREEMFRRRFAETDGEQKLVLELLAAHCLQPDDSTDFALVRDDFIAILKAGGLGNDAANSRFSAAMGRLHVLGLVGQHYDARPEVRVWIAKQWYALVLDALRREGRRL